MKIQDKKRSKDEKDILDAAKKACEEVTGIPLTFETPHPREERQPDAVLKLSSPEGKTKEFYVLVRGSVTKETIGHVAEQMRRLTQPTVLVTRYVPPPLAERCKKLEIPFIDTAGNAYLPDPPLFVYVVGKKSKAGYPVERISRIFRPAGLKVVFALLCIPDLVRRPYRHIANATGVAVGTVGWIMTDLKRLGYMVERGRWGRKLVNLDKLLDAWVQVYPRELRPRMHRGTYDTTDRTWWEKTNWGEWGASLGGEPAAARLTGYLQPETITVYGPKDMDSFLLENRLRKDPEGKTEILRKFWNFDYPETNTEIAPPLLIYADLLATGDDRNIETARIVYDRYIQKLSGKS